MNQRRIFWKTKWAYRFLWVYLCIWYRRWYGLSLLGSWYGAPWMINVAVLKRLTGNNQAQTQPMLLLQIFPSCIHCILYSDAQNIFQLNNNTKKITLNCLPFYKKQSRTFNSLPNRMYFLKKWRNINWCFVINNFRNFGNVFRLRLRLWNQNTTPAGRE